MIENLKPLKTKGDPYSDSIRAKLKGSSSDKRKIAQRIAGLKKANPERLPDKINKLISDPKVSAYEIMLLLEFIREKGLEEGMRHEVMIQLVNAYIKAHTALHGSKMFSVNMNLSPDSSKSMNEIYLEVLNERNNRSEKDTESKPEGNTKGSTEK